MTGETMSDFIQNLMISEAAKRSYEIFSILSVTDRQRVSSIINNELTSPESFKLFETETGREFFIVRLLYNKVAIIDPEVFTDYLIDRYDRKGVSNEL